jgi:hypothetical protein
MQVQFYSHMYITCFATKANIIMKHRHLPAIKQLSNTKYVFVMANFDMHLFKKSLWNNKMFVYIICSKNDLFCNV